MRNNTNIYDIDGNILREAGDNEQLDIETAKKRLEEYKEKVKQLSDNEEDRHEVNIYNTYIKNLGSYVFNYYMTHPEMLNDFKKNTTEDEIQKAMHDLKEEVEKDETIMDEYVEPIEEIKDEK